jgi:hypothetical protein
VANPLPSSIDWSTITAGNRVNINNAFYRWEGSQYRCYLPAAETFVTGIVASGAGPIIPSSQGFFVYVLGASPQVGTLTINEANKVSGSGTFYRTNVVKENQLGIGISGQGFEDVAGIWFKPEATTGFDANMEAHKMTNPALNISTPTSDGLDMVYNSLPMFDESTIVPLHVRSAVQGTFTLSFGDVNTFAPGTEVYLRDNYLSQIIALEELTQYSFEINGDAASQGTDRFEIVFSGQAVTKTAPTLGKFGTSIFPNPGNGRNLTIVLKNAVDSESNVVITDVLGKVLLNQNFAAKGNSISLDSDLPMGVYQVKIQNGGKTSVQKIVVNR